MAAPRILDATILDATGARLAGLELQVSGDASATSVAVLNASSATAWPEAAILRLDHQASAIVEHGWQSWSTVRRSSPPDVRPERAGAPRWFRAEMLADPAQAGRRVVADQWLVTDSGSLGSANPEGPPVAFHLDDDGHAVATVLLEGHRLEPGEQLVVGELRGEDLHDAVAASHGRAAGPSRLGWCSWYHYFDQLAPEHIRSNAALAAAHGLDLVQIDDGWQREVGTWDAQSPAFDVDVAVLADEITAAGMQAGIWSAPFIAIAGGELASAHPDWLVTAPHGHPRTAMHHGGWGGELGRVYALDTTNPAVLEHLTATYAGLRAKGFTYFKVDFLFAAAIQGQRMGGDRVLRTQALRRGLEAVREGIGEDAYLLGCGSPLVPALGLVDAMRVSEDVAPHWEPRIFAPGFPESSVATRNAIEQSALRAPLHRRWWQNDPDCLLLRPSETELSAHERRVLADAVLGLGGFCVLSDDLGLYGAAEWELVEELRSAIPVVDQPLVTVNPFATPLVVEGPGHRLEVDWDAPSAKLSLG